MFIWADVIRIREAILELGRFKRQRTVRFLV
jgi:hypothetical protein